MTELAALSGLTREGLYKALKAGAQPRFDTVTRVLFALGMELHIKAA
jgi:probable addiction module antidote protein